MRHGGGPLWLAILLAGAGAAAALAAPGDLDTRFDGDGKQTVDFGGNDVAWSVEVDPQGRIVSAGFSAAPFQFAVTRLTSRGAPDTTFSGDGNQKIAFALDARADDLALQPDGKIVVAGGANSSADLAIARLTSAGEPDGEFGADGNSDGQETLAGWGDAAALALQTDGKIVVVGTDVDPAGGTTADIVVSRLRPDGSPDPDFDGDGRQYIDFGAADNGFGLALQPDGKIVAVGAVYNAAGTESDFGVARLLPTGAPDPSFPKRQIDFTPSDVPTSVVVQGDERIAVGGGTNDDFAVTRMNQDGSPDSSFDLDSKKTIDFGGTDFAYGLAQQPNGKLVLAGDTSVGENMAVARVQPGGALDTTFDSDGKQTVEFGGADGADALALEPNGAIVLAGFGSPTQDFTFARLDGEPPLPGGGGPGGGLGGDGTPGGAVPRCDGKRATIVGTQRKETLRGTRRADVIVALGGDDRVLGAAGNDIVCGGNGNDRIGGDVGNDRLFGGSGRDSINGATGNDLLDGGALDDRLEGGSGRDALTGGPGKDRLAGGSGRDRLAGGRGRDSCLGGPGADRATCERQRGV
jgi:uncharacterized delta-60 repeat protein